MCQRCVSEIPSGISDVPSFQRLFRDVCAPENLDCQGTLALASLTGAPPFFQRQFVTEALDFSSGRRRWRGLAAGPPRWSAVVKLLHPGLITIAHCWLFTIKDKSEKCEGFFYKRTQSRFVLAVLNGGKRHTSCGPCTSKVLEAMHDARLRRPLEGSQLEMRYFARRNERELRISFSIKGHCFALWFS